MYHSYITTFYYLLKTELKIFRQLIKDKLIDLFIWVVTIGWVTAYLMPYFGLQESYTTFMVASLVASAGLFELYASITWLVADFEGNNLTSYYLTLPIPSWLIFVKSMLFYAFTAAAMSVLVLPINKLILWNYVDISQFNFFTFLLMFILSNLFYGAFTIWVASRIMGIEKLGSVWMRFVYPIWFMGGFQFSYASLETLNPLLAKLSLINPMIYIMEGFRAAIMGPDGSLPILLCSIMLIIFIFASGVHGIYKLKKRLDF